MRSGTDAKKFWHLQASPRKERSNHEAQYNSRISNGVFAVQEITKKCFDVKVQHDVSSFTLPFVGQGMLGQ